jgi:hypothetical protein
MKEQNLNAIGAMVARQLESSNDRQSVQDRQRLQGT